MSRYLACLAFLLLPFAGIAQSNVIATVPISFQRGQIMVAATVNASDSLNFLLDTGFSMTMLRPDLVEKLGLRRVGEIVVEGIAGDERAATFEGATFDLGGARYSPRRVGAMTGSRRRRDGIIGSGLFRQYVVAIDLGTKQLRLLSPSTFSYEGRGEVVPLRFRRSTPIIDARVALTNGSFVIGTFEVDTGCDSGICLGHDFTEKHGLLESAATEAGRKVGVGGGATTRSGHLSEIRIGNLTVEKPETDFFLEGSPVESGMAGHIGMGLLKAFRIYFDYPHARMILERLAK